MDERSNGRTDGRMEGEGREAKSSSAPSSRFSQRAKIALTYDCLLTRDAIALRLQQRYSQRVTRVTRRIRVLVRVARIEEERERERTFSSRLHSHIVEQTKLYIARVI